MLLNLIDALSHRLLCHVPPATLDGDFVTLWFKARNAQLSSCSVVDKSQTSSPVNFSSLVLLPINGERCRAGGIDLVQLIRELALAYFALLPKAALVAIDTGRLFASRALIARSLS